MGGRLTVTLEAAGEICGRTRRTAETLWIATFT